MGAPDSPNVMGLLSSWSEPMPVRGLLLCSASARQGQKGGDVPVAGALGHFELDQFGLSWAFMSGMAHGDKPGGHEIVLPCPDPTCAHSPGEQPWISGCHLSLSTTATASSPSSLLLFI